MESLIGSKDKNTFITQPIKPYKTIRPEMGSSGVKFPCKVFPVEIFNFADSYCMIQTDIVIIGAGPVGLLLFLKQVC